MSFKIKSIDSETGNVTVTFDCDKVEQVLAGKTITDPDSLKQELTDYEAAYVAGLAVEAADVVPADVQALVGETITTEG